MSIRGNTVGTPTPRSDWNQNDPKKADFIKNKPTTLLTNTEAHLGNKSNPHGVTASQVGATPASHASDKNNPHGVTAAQVGAAPASGFVSRNYVNNVEALNAWIDQLVAAQDVGTEKTYYTTLGWYQNAPLPTGRWSITIHKPDVSTEPTWAGVTATVIASQRIHKLCREMYSGAWLDWEWENPYMELGKEYRTTERWQGKAVYTKIVDCGALPSIENGKWIESRNGAKMLRYAGSLSNGWALPFKTPYGEISVTATTSAVILYVVADNGMGADLTTLTAQVQVWYTKD